MKKLISNCLAAGMAAGLTFGAFAEDAYVEANGTQCVAVDCQPTKKTRYEVDFQFTTEAVQKSAVVLGWENSGVRLGMWSNGNGNIESPFGMGNDDWSHGMIAYDTVRHTAIIDRKANVYTMTTNGKVIGTVQKPDHEGTVTGENHRRLSLFGNLNNDYMLKASNRSKLKIFRVKVYDDDVLTHDYVPCKKGADAGFYDLETKAFFGRICGDALIAGGDVLTVEDDPYVSSPNGLVTVMTGYTVTPDTCLEADFTFDSEVVQQYAFEAGPSGTPVGRVYVTNSKTVKWFWGDTATSVEATGSADNPADNRPGVRRQLTLDSFKNSASFASYGLSNATFTMPTTRTKDSGSSPLRLFSNSSGNSGFATMKLYGFKIYEKGVLKHDYEPMKWNSIGVLRDRVTGRVLFANKNATAVNDLSFGGKIRELPYIESTGGQQIVLDYKTNAKTYLEVGLFHVDSKKSTRLFGVVSSDSIYGWVNGGGTGETWGNPEINVHGVWTGRLQTNAKDDYLRAYVVNMSNDTVYNYIGGYAEKAIAMSGKSGYVHDRGECSKPIAVFNVNPVDTYPGAAFCLTHVTVMEDGEVIHLYEPYIKDGLVGLKDAKTGKFFTGLNGGNDTALLYGGDIAYEGATPDAYVESDGTQFVPTDYKFNEKSRIELDFQCVSPKTGVALAAAWNAGPSWVGFYRNGSGNLEFVTPNAANTDKSHASTGLKADLGRYQAIIDAPAKISQFKNGATLCKETTVAAFTGTASLPLGLFGNTHTAEKGGFTELAAVRIYSLRIKEKEGDAYVLKREYLPYKSGETVGFRDSVTGAIIVNTAPDANPLKVGGMGVEGSGSVFKVVPEGGTIDIGGSATLRAYAPGAVKYRWTKDGKVLAETTTDMLVVNWERRPRESVYGVTPIYSVFGHEVEGEGVTATLENVPRGMRLLFR